MATFSISKHDLNNLSTNEYAEYAEYAVNYSPRAIINMLGYSNFLFASAHNKHKLKIKDFIPNILKEKVQDAASFFGN